MIHNVTAFLPQEYNKSIRQTLPYYDEFYKQIFDVVNCCFDNRISWLDIGCGTGNMASLGLELSDRFVLCDNSSAMLNTARKHITSDKAEFVLKSALEIEYASEFDIVTAIQVFHYLSEEERRIAVNNCYKALKPNGIFFTFENFAPDTKHGTKLYLDRWKQYQIHNGKTVQESQNHIARYGKDYFPISIDDHKKLMKACGFNTVELLWCSYMQAGFIGIK